MRSMVKHNERYTTERVYKGKDYGRVRRELVHQILRVLAIQLFGCSKRIRNTFLLIVSDVDDGCVLWAAKVLLLFRVKAQKDRSGIEYVLRQFMESTPALDEVDEELCWLCLRCDTRDKNDQSLVVGVELNRRVELKVVGRVEVKLFSVILGITTVVRDACGIPLLSSAFQRPYHRSCINWSYRDYLLKQRIIKKRHRKTQ